MYDLVLQGGTIVDGTGAKPYVANLCIEGGKIAAITTESVNGKQVMDVSGLAVAPGFIDIHSHSETYPTYGGLPENVLRQGVTTQAPGNCGSSLLPAFSLEPGGTHPYCLDKFNHPGFPSVTDYAESMGKVALSCNYAPMAGPSTLRCSVVGQDDRRPTEEEMALMCQVLDRELDRGIFGMTLGLIYPPSSFADEDELVELAKVIAKHDGILAVHMRNEGPRLFDSVKEMLEIARKSGVHLQISHLKLMGKPQWGKAPQLTAMIEQAQAEGVNVTCDQYPFPASSTALTALIPRWAADGGPEALLKRVETREGTIMADIAREMDNRGGPHCVLIASANDCPQYPTKYISDIAKEMGIAPEEAVRQILLDTRAKCQCIYFSINQEDICHIMSKTWVRVSSDGSDRLYEGNDTLHPRNFATFSHYFQTARDFLPLETVVYKETGLTAKIMGLKDRGVLKEGNWADIAIFDPEKYASRSTFLKPNVPPTGMYHVLLAGQFVVRDEQITDNKPGKVILKNH